MEEGIGITQKHYNITPTLFNSWSFRNSVRLNVSTSGNNASEITMIEVNLVLCAFVGSSLPKFCGSSCGGKFGKMIGG